jgi:hypothetical protein
MVAEFPLISSVTEYVPGLENENDSISPPVTVAPGRSPTRTANTPLPSALNVTVSPRDTERLVGENPDAPSNTVLAAVASVETNAAPPAGDAEAEPLDGAKVSAVSVAPVCAGAVSVGALSDTAVSDTVVSDIAASVISEPLDVADFLSSPQAETLSARNAVTHRLSVRFRMIRDPFMFLFPIIGFSGR